MIKEKSAQGQEAAVAIVRSLAKEIFSELDQDQQGTLDWNEFKNIQTQQADNIQEIEDYVCKIEPKKTAKKNPMSEI